MTDFNVETWISEKKQSVQGVKDFYKTDPPLRVCNDTEFFLFPTGMTQRITNERPPGYGSIYSNSIKFCSVSGEKIGQYNNGNVSLMFCRVPNSLNRGTFGLKYSNVENFLITSGGLSGCTVCSVFLPESKEIYFFHTGKSSSVCKFEYTQQMKNADLYRSILISLESQIDSQIFEKISDEDLFSKLSFLCSNYAQKIVIDIYISDASAKASHSKVHVNDEVIKRKGDKYSLTLRYYKVRANLFVSKYNKLYSVHYMVNDNIYSTF
ncbi:MAG: hypothetical protein K2K91_01885, partial [Ruminococcus sp.]|nr:hypothetical protein [Ruminococcus sp.]